MGRRGCSKSSGQVSTNIISEWRGGEVEVRHAGPLLAKLLGHSSTEVADMAAMSVCCSVDGIAHSLL